MLRIVAGDWRGRRLASAPDSRPTSQRVREALFSIWLDRVEGCRFLDLFSGGGAIGLEAASRGASFVTFVENAKKAVDTVRRNCEVVSYQAFEVVEAELPGALLRPPFPKQAGYDLVFADPPYAFAAYGDLVQAASACVASGGELALEHGREVQISSPQGDLKLEDSRTYGRSSVSFFRRGRRLLE